MKFNPGEKVIFLNSKGGGIIKRIIDSRLVLVTIEDGFDIPVMTSEIIHDRGEQPVFRPQQRTEPAPQEQPVKKEEISEELSKEIILNRKSEDIYLAFMPQDQKWLITGPVDILLVNNTSADLLYSICSKDPEGGYRGVDYGSVLAGTKPVIATIERDDLSQWIEGSIQFLFHKEHTEEVPLPFNADYSLQGKKFYSESNYRDSKLVHAKAIVVRVGSIEYPSSRAGKDTEPLKEESAVLSEPKDDIIFRHMTKDREAEVDLHIHEIIEDPSVLEKNEILEYQKNYFTRCLESAISNHFRKVIFIHGVGNGILREVILDHLLKHKGINVFDAPMSKYGVGAVEVRIPHNLS